MLRLMTTLLMLATAAMAQDDPLPSWNEGSAKTAILAFVADVTDESADTFVPVADRIAVFDNDGTLWAEQPVYFQFLFALDRARALAAADPAWAATPALQAATAGDVKALMEGARRRWSRWSRPPTPA